jgi:outer membrane protein assembly factor BamB
MCRSEITLCGSGLQRALLIFVFLVSTQMRDAVAGDVWPSFQNGGNTSVDVKDLPAEWSPDSGIAWKIELPGYGQSAPVVWQKQIYVTAIEGDQKEHCIIAAYDVETGNSLWQKTFDSSVPSKASAMVSRAAPTPLVDSDGVCVLFESGDLRALTHGGELRWSLALFDRADKAFNGNHGYGASPAQTDSHVIVLVDQKSPGLSYLAAISKASGEIVWKTERTERASWASPQVARFEGHSQIVVSSGGSVDGYDAADGKMLWTKTGLSGNTIPSVTLQDDLVFVGASEPRSGGSADQAAASNCCLRITPQSESGFALQWAAEKAVCSYVSPLVHQGYAYYVNSVGVLRCIDVSTGKQQYEVRMGTPCWAQPIANRDRLYFFGKSGITKVVKAGPVYELLVENRMWSDETPPVSTNTQKYESAESSAKEKSASESLDPVVYGVAAVDGAFIARLGTHLFRIGMPQTQSPVTLK